jgi:hypothetical protein
MVYTISPDTGSPSCGGGGGGPPPALSVAIHTVDRLILSPFSPYAAGPCASKCPSAASIAIAITHRRVHSTVHQPVFLSRRPLTESAGSLRETFSRCRSGDAKDAGRQSVSSANVGASQDRTCNQRCVSGAVALAVGSWPSISR